MVGKTFDLDEIIVPDQVGTEISRFWHNWDMARDAWKKDRVEIKQFVFATDTNDTTNRTLPWNNKTHIPKLCQIRDNLFANYMASLFPKRKWLIWEGTSKEDSEKQKEEAIRDYMGWVVSQRQFKDEIAKLIYDYLDDGNLIVTSEWRDESTLDPETNMVKPGYVGPVPVRINPLDVVMNPLAPTAKESPKIIRSLWTMGEAKKFIDAVTATPEQKQIADEVWKYMMELRNQASNTSGAFKEKDEIYNISGFNTYNEYLGSNYVEMLSFYGDFYDREKDKFYPNHMIVVVDRHKVILNKQHPIPSGNLPFHHCAWRVRQDNLWGMGPLDNLVGLQYRINHVENMKADIFDLTTYPPLKIKGFVEDFEWAPFSRIHCDADGDVELMTPKADILAANIEIQTYEQRMEEMAGSPKEAMGFRTPGEKTAYEVQRLENAASRIFQSKIMQFEEQVLEPLLNDMLALARENLTDTTIRVIDDEFKSTTFRNLTREDLSAQGRLKPVAARHFAERAEQVQNVNNFFASALGQDPEIKAHFSTIKLAEMFEELLDLQDFEIVQPYVRLSEQADAQSRMNVNEEQIMAEIGTPAGISEDDIG